MKHGTQSVPGEGAPVGSDELIREGYAALDDPLTHPRGLVRRLTEQVEMLEERVRILETSPWYRDYVEVGRQVLALHEKLVSRTSDGSGEQK